MKSANGALFVSAVHVCMRQMRSHVMLLCVLWHVGCGISFRTPSINGRPISAEKDSFLSIVGTCVEQKNVTLYTVQG